MTHSPIQPTDNSQFCNACNCFFGTINGRCSKCLASMTMSQERLMSFVESGKDVTRAQPTHDAEELKRIIRENVWGYICQTCGGSGTTEGNVECFLCRGLGIKDWHYEIVIEALLAREQTLKDQAAIEARIDQTFKVIQSLVKSGSISDKAASSVLSIHTSKLKQQKESL